MKNLKAETLQTKMVNALQARIDNAPNENQRDNLTAELKKFSGENNLYVFSAAKALEIDIEKLAEKIALSPSSENKDNFVAVYALQKIRKALFAFAATTSNKSFFDGYSKSIITNLVRLQTLTGKSTRAALCAIEYDELDQVQDIKRLMNCAESTANTQASSTRMMLHYLDVCNVVKRGKGDALSFKDSKASARMQELFTVA